MIATSFRTRIKVCCIAGAEEARLAISLGADALGLVGAMPSGPGIISDEQARQIATAVPPPVFTFLLSSETEAGSIADHVRQVGASAVQIVNHIDPAQSERLVTLLPDVRRIQVIHVEDDKSVDLAGLYEPFCNALLLDSGKPTAKTPQLGGTGRVHDWRLSRKIVEVSRLPVFLAGGLNPGNVADAIAAVRPYGLDICSGVRTNDCLDANKLLQFVQAVADSDQNGR